MLDAFARGPASVELNPAVGAQPADLKPKRRRRGNQADAVGAVMPEPMPSTLTPALSRAARALVAWSQDFLADKAAVSRSTVRDFEKGRHRLQHASERRIVEALWQAGVTVSVTSGGDQVVLLRRPTEGTS